MADETQGSGDDILLNINVTGREELKGARTDAKGLKDEIDGVGNQDVSAPIKSLKQQLREAVIDTQKLVAQGKAGSEEFRNAAKRVAEIKDQIQDLNKTFEAFNPDNKFRVFSQVAAAGANIVQGYAGAMAFLGVNSEEAAKTIAKLQGIMAFTQSIESLHDLADSYRNLKALLGFTTVSQVQLNEAQAIGVETTALQTTTTEGLTVAEEGAEVAAIGLGTALKAIGIGLLISAIAYLVSNFDKVKKAVDSLFPSLGTAGNLFDKVKEIAFGFGNVVLQFIVAPIKILVDLIQGDLKAAIKDAGDALNVVQNFKNGYNKEAESIAEDNRKIRVQKEIEANERIIKERKALGASTTKLEIENNRLKISVLDKDNKDFEKKKADLESDITQIQNAEYKKQNDKYKEKLKADLDLIKASNKENLKTVQEGATTQRNIELTDLDVKYNKELALLNKRKQNVKDYNKEYNTLIEARKIEETRVNKKYDDIIKAYNDEVNQAYFDAYDKKTAEINKKADEALKSAGNPNQRNQIEQDRAFQLANTKAESIASASAKAAKTALTGTETTDRPLDTDTPEEAAIKSANREQAKLDAENKAYELKKVQLQGQYDELAQLEADHEKNITDITDKSAEERKEIAKREQEAKEALLDLEAQALDGAANIAGKNTIAGKALAVASATISTYLSAQKAYESQFLPVPDLTSPFRGALAAGAAIATGIASVKNILAVQVPNSAGGGSSVGGGTPAPVINSTVLTQANSGTNNVVNAVQQQNAQPLKAFIVNKDLDDQKKRADFYNAQSTY